MPESSTDQSIAPADAPSAPRRPRADESRFIKACRRQPVDRTPIWLMRQAGRFMPEFREIRSRYSFLDLCKNPDMACEVTVMAVEMLKVDAAIIFADILLPIDALNMGLEYVKGEGPVIHSPITAAADVAKLPAIDVRQSLQYVFDAVRLTSSALPADIPLIGFAGAPFTLASYMIEAGSSKNFDKTKAFMYREPAAWDALMERIVDITAQYLLHQVEAGANALQLFDSWVGCLSPADYQRFVQPYSKKLISQLGQSVPVIHFGTGTTTLLKHMRDAGGDVIGLDWRINLADGWAQIGYDRAVQGNLDPCVLFAPREHIAQEAGQVLRAAANRPGHIFNLGHGVLPGIDPDAVKYLVEFVQSAEVKA